MTIKFTVPEISCDHCKSTIIDTLSTVDVIELVEVSIETKDVTLKSSEEIDLDLVKSLLDKQGYTVVSWYKDTHSICRRNDLCSLCRKDRKSFK